MKNLITDIRNSTEVSGDKFKEISQKVEPRDLCRKGEKNKTISVSASSRSNFPVIVVAERTEEKEARSQISNPRKGLTRVSWWKESIGAQESRWEEAHTTGLTVTLHSPGTKRESCRFLGWEEWLT